MHSVKLTIAKFLSVLFVACGLQMGASAQENSPFSRYGLGDLTPNHNIFTRGMAGISAAVVDPLGINFTNPAALANISNTILDIGLEIDVRTLKNTNPAKKFTSANTYVPYLQLGFPTSTPKMKKKEIYWGTSFGIRPVSKINYKIEKHERLTGIDSLQTMYEGSGGVNEAFIGTGIKIKNVSVGLTAGYMFGNKDHSTRLNFINDSVFYYMSNSSTNTKFGGLFISGGVQYEIVLDNPRPGMFNRTLRFGLYGNLKKNLNASSNIIRETTFYNPNGGYIRLDSVFHDKDVKGEITYPAMAGFGFTYQGAQWMYGADIEYWNWSNYRYYGQTDQVQNSWMIRAGTQYYPASEKKQTKKYFNFVKYRAGFYYGSDYVNVNGNRPEYGFTLGTGMPLTSLKRISYSGEYVVLNTALELGNRGNKQTGLRETIFRFSVGVSMNARWFQKPKYN